MYYQWNNEIKKRLQQHFTGIKEKLTDLHKRTVAFLKTDLRAEIEKSMSQPFEKNSAKMKLEMVYHKKLDESLLQAIQLQP